MSESAYITACRQFSGDTKQHFCRPSKVTKTSKHMDYMRHMERTFEALPVGTYIDGDDGESDGKKAGSGNGNGNGNTTEMDDNSPAAATAATAVGAGGHGHVHINSTGTLQLDKVDVAWVRSSRFVLYLVDVDSVPGLAADVDNIMDHFASYVAKTRTSASSSVGAGNKAAMMSLEWRSLQGLVKSAEDRKLQDHSTRDVFGDSKLKEWIAATQERLHNAAMDALVTTLKSEISREIVKAKQELPKLERDKAQVAREVIPDVPMDPIVTDLQVLDPSSPEYQQVANKHSGHNFQLSCIKKVNVPQRVAKYNAYRQHLNQSANNKSEDLTYHGTKSIPACDAIARNGPDISLAGSANAAAFGKGFYTTTDITYSKNYATATGGMLICKVAPGDMKVGDASVTAANIAPHHSVTDGSGAFRVLFHPDAVLVEYILSFGADQSVSEAALLKEQARQKAIAKKKLLEDQKQAKLDRIDSHIKMTRYFIRFCERLNPQINPSNVMFYDKQFKLELQQYEGKLPMYAYKEEFLGDMSRNQMMILKGGTGIGKTVTIPQWAYDHLLCRLDAPADEVKRVAVLVPRKIIAVTLAERLCSMRGCEIGHEIGVGTSDEYLTSVRTRITFFTYGFFRAIQTSDPLFSQWDIVVCDEVHERVMDAEFLMLHLGQACRERSMTSPRPLRLIVMSATIDVNIFSTMLTDYSPQKQAPALLDVPGVTYPVEDIWWNGEPWDPTGPGALDELCVEVLRAFNQDDDGNTLVFVSTARNAIDCAEKMKAMVAHDPSIDVSALYASLSDAEKTKVESYHSDPANQGRRMICFATRGALRYPASPSWWIAEES
jgi:hypothetical protein